MKALYKVEFKLNSASVPMGYMVRARNKEEAYDKAVYRGIPECFDGQTPYSAWVSSVEYSNGHIRNFNTFEGKPY